MTRRQQSDLKTVLWMLLGNHQNFGPEQSRRTTATITIESVNNNANIIKDIELEIVEVEATTIIIMYLNIVILVSRL